MKIGIGLLLVLVLVMVSVGCTLKKPDATNTLEITQDDEKVILEYLDTKTDDIAAASTHASGKGKMYSAFKILGTDRNKIYIWLVKTEYFKDEKNISRGSTVQLPVVLKIKKKNNGISVINHEYPEDGEGFGRSVKRLFPPNIQIPFFDYENKQKLEDAAKARADEDLI